MNNGQKRTHKHWYQTILCLTLLFTLIVSSFPLVSHAAQTTDTHIICLRIDSPLTFLNGNAAQIDSQGTKPIILKGRTMLPLRFISEKMGASVRFVNNDTPIVITMGTTKVTVTLNSSKMAVEKNGVKTTKTLDSKVVLHKGRTLVPIRAISESLGFYVHYGAAKKTVVVSNTTLIAVDRNKNHTRAGNLPLNPVSKQKSALVINKTSVSLIKGNSCQLLAYPKDSKERCGLTWTSSDKSVATIDAYGIVKAKKAGQTAITVKSAGGQYAYCLVTVSNSKEEPFDPNFTLVSKVTLDRSNLTLYVWTTAKEQARYGKPGASAKSWAYLYETVSPWNASNPAIKWSSSNTSVATVDGEGRVTGRAAGTATIKATAHNGKSASCIVTVKANVRTCVYDEALSKEVFKLVNAFRAENGVPMLNYNADCVGIAYRQAEYNSVEQISDRAYHGIGQCGAGAPLYPDSKIKEIPPEIVEAWKISPAHRNALVDLYGENDEYIPNTEGGCAVFVNQLNGVPDDYVCIFYFDKLDPNTGKIVFYDTPVAKWKP